MNGPRAIAAARPPAPGSLPAHHPRALLRRQLALLAAAVFIVAAGYGGLMPVLPAWLAQYMPQADAADVARHVGFLSGAYAAGVLVGAPVWGFLSDRVGRGRILIFGMVGFVASLLLLLLVSPLGGVPAIYVLRTSAGLSVAAIIPVVTAIVAAHTPASLRARRFAWLGAVSLLGFLFGPALNPVAETLMASMTGGESAAVMSANFVIVFSAALGAAVMLGLALTLPPRAAGETEVGAGTAPDRQQNLASLLVLSGAVTFVLAGFELGIVLQGQQHAGITTRQVALMFAECSLVMLAVNAMLFFTSLMDKAPARALIAIGLLLALAGLAILARHRATEWMYVGISLTAAGTGLVFPVISFLAAGASSQRLGSTMGAIAAAAGLGQTLGSAAGGWLFGSVMQLGFAWLALPLVVALSWMGRSMFGHRRVDPRDAKRH